MTRKRKQRDPIHAALERPDSASGNGNGAPLAPNQSRAAWTHVQLEEIVAYQKRHGLDGSTLARRLGIARGTFYKWKRGGSVPPLEAQARIRAILGGATAAASVTPAPKPTVPADPTKAKLLELLHAAITSSGTPVSPSDLPGLIRDMRAALEV